jgi:hypothetical protein
MCRLWVIKTIRGSIPTIAITDDWLWDFDFRPRPLGRWRCGLVQLRVGLAALSEGCVKPSTSLP